MNIFLKESVKNLAVIFWRSYMKKTLLFIITIFIVFGSTSTFANPKCQVHNLVQKLYIDVPVVEIEDLRLTKPIVINFKETGISMVRYEQTDKSRPLVIINFQGIDVSVTYQLEGSSFTMRLGDVSSTFVINKETDLDVFKIGVLRKGDIKLKCWFERNK